jgi:thioredoxin reductase (NADPH)
MSANAYDVIVIGAGIAGLAATKQLLQHDKTLRVANIEAGLFGGLVVNVEELDGEVAGSGIDLASGLMMEASDLGATMLSEQVEAIAPGPSGWRVTTAGETYSARAVIVASGASLKKLGVPGEAQFEHKGVSQCACCDGPMFSGQDVVVVGGGDSALQEARVLAGLCAQVHVVNRADRFTGKPELVAGLERCTNVTVRHQTEILAIHGDDAVEKVSTRNLADGSVGDIACRAVFAFVGLEPRSDFVPASFARDNQGRLLTDRSLRAAEALLVAGAVRCGCGGMLADAIADGCAAANEALRTLTAAAVAQPSS